MMDFRMYHPHWSHLPSPWQNLCPKAIVTPTENLKQEVVYKVEIFQHIRPKIFQNFHKRRSDRFSSVVDQYSCAPLQSSVCETRQQQN